MKNKASTQAQLEQYFPASGNSLRKTFSAQKKGQPCLLINKMMQNVFCANH
jgi:hypothetical protein